MFFKKSALSSDETVNSARPRHRNIDQQRARAYKKERMFQTYLALNKKKKKKNTLILVCKLNQNYKSLSGKSWADLHDVGFS